jgi:HK97 family phage major capsid protein
MSEIAELVELKQTLHTLNQAVADMKAGQVDKTTVEKIATDMLELQAAATAGQNRSRGYFPDANTEDPLDALSPNLQSRLGTIQGRIEYLQSTPAKRAAATLKRDPGDVERFQQAADNLVLLQVALGANGKSTDVRDLSYFHEEYLPALRQAGAMDSATTAEGKEYVPTMLSSNLIERITLELKVAAIFPTIPMPTNPFNIPGRPVSRTRTSKQVEQTSDTGQTKFTTLVPGTRLVALTAAKFAGEILTSRDLEEDSLIAILPFMQDELVDYVAADIEDCIINGDTTGTHQDSDVTAATDPRKNWKGLRVLAISGAKTDGSNAALSLAMLRTNRKVMGKYGIIPSDLVHVLGINGYIQLLADGSLITMEKYGAQATVLTGELGRADGVPVVVSEYVRTDLNATGVYDGSTTNRSAALTVHQKGYVIGNRREVTVQVLREIYAESDQDAIVLSVRKAFSPRFTSTTEKTVANTYNLLT